MYLFLSVLEPKIVTNELHSYTKILELFITRGIMRSFHSFISFVLRFIFGQFFTFYKRKPMYFGLLLLMMQFFTEEVRTRLKKCAP